MPWVSVSCLAPYLTNRRARPAGELLPWISLWQFRQLRATKRVFGLPVDGGLKLLSASYIVPGWLDASWQSWQRLGTFSVRSFTERLPCGLWQFRQLSSTGACSNRNGPRLSAWHVVQSSLMLSAFTIAGDSAPCGLWQLVHFTLPSTIGWCDGRATSARMSRWQLKQTSCCGTLLVVSSGAICGLLTLSSWSLPPCVLWQLVHDTSFLRCLPL